MQIIVLTGTIGSGKSTVARILKEMGAPVIDTDEMARHVIDPGTSAYQAVIQTFGTDILSPTLTIDRKKLAARVFKNPRDLQLLNQIIHPVVDGQVESFFEKQQNAGQKAVFVEMAILPDARWKERVTQVWVVKVAQDIALRRLEQRGLSESEALARLDNQSAPEKKVKTGLTIITNDGDLAQLSQQVVNLWNKIDNEYG